MLKKLTDIQPADQAVQMKDKPFTEYAKNHKERKSFAEKLCQNAVIGALVLLCITAASTGTGGAALLTAVQSSLKQDWDESLGRLTFVSAMLPDTVQVFFSNNDELLSAPCSGSVVHTWTEAEPYIGYGVYSRNVYPAMSGTVVGIGHGEDEEKIVRISHPNGLETVYYNLSTLEVAEGDEVSANTLLGSSIEGSAVYLEVRKDGIAIDPSAMLRQRSNP